MLLNLAESVGGHVVTLIVECDAALPSRPRPRPRLLNQRPLLDDNQSMANNPNDKLNLSFTPRIDYSCSGREQIPSRNLYSE